ncbi:hypothetical protein VR010_11150 [Actinomycetaceae bacterium L2_0104]
MGLFDIFRKRDQGSQGDLAGPPAQPDLFAPPAPAPAPSPSPMLDPGHSPSVPGATATDFSPLIEAAAIISGNDPRVIEDITLLVNNEEGFAATYPRWYEEMDIGFGDLAPRERYLNLFAYWMVGYDTDVTYGAYIDWKEAPEDFLWQLRRAVKKLGYPLDVDAVVFSGEESTQESLAMIDAYLDERGYALVHLDTESDCYHLFIVPRSDVPRLFGLGRAVNVDFMMPW